MPRLSSPVAGKSVRNYPRYKKEPKNLFDSLVTGDTEKTLHHVSKSTGSLSDTLNAPGIYTFSNAKILIIRHTFGVCEE
jgi:hypothetical protein